MVNFLRLNKFLIYFLSVSVIVLAAVLFFVIGFYINNNSLKIALAANQELGGFAWAARPVPFGTELGGPGWISFNCLDGGAGACVTSDYKVFYSDVTGWLEGYAWSSNIGWIRFYDFGFYPESPNTMANINLATGAVTGWARACAVFQSGCMGALKPDYERGGWDGWIKMAGTATDGSPYGLRFDNISGRFLPNNFAWGSNVIGWINFCITPGTTMCVGRVSGALPPPTTATTTPPGGWHEVPPS
ncbi:MAG: hypothetical protein NUV83_03430 [Candidatus Wolfebacteria bacterium]|nr:hypothetical protein [Candidatus Wolfebacteria bacterium]